MSEPEEDTPEDSPEEDSVELPPGMLYRLAWVLYLLMAISALLWIGAISKRLPLELLVDAQSWGLDVGVGVLAGLALAALWLGARSVLPGMRAMEADMVHKIGRLDSSEVIALAIISGFSEELFFRGAVQLAWGWPWALVLFTLCYTSSQRTFLYWTAFALVQGAAFGGLMLWRGNLTAPILAHMVASAVTLRGLMAEAETPR